MNKEEIKKMIADDFDNFINERLDGAIIFKYISNLEKENKQLKERLQQKEDIINKSKEHLELKVIRYSNETDYMLDENDLKEIIQILDNKGE